MATGLVGAAVSVAVAAVLVGTLVRSPSPALGTRYPGGIPTSLNGEPVYLGLGAVLHADATTNASPFLVGGWFGDGSRNICTGGSPGLGTPDPTLFRSGCGTAVGGDSPSGANSWPGPQGTMAWNGHSLPGGVGPSIVRVHTHDPLAAQCSSATRGSCEATLVVDDVLWTGDSLTAASPVSVIEAVNSLDGLPVQEKLPVPGGSLVIERHVFPTVRQQPCPPPWPTEVFDLHGDPRFGLLVVFPDVAARTSAQPLLDSTANDCPTDPRIIRPATRVWVAEANVLVLVYGSDVAAATKAALSTATNPAGAQASVLGFPVASVDESYRVLADFLSARESGSLEKYPSFLPTVQPPASKNPAASSTGYDAYVADAKRRYAANALGFSIGPANMPAEVDVGAAAWDVLANEAVAGTARLFEVDHAGSTVPALRHETYVAYELKHPDVDSWALLLVAAEVWPPES